MNRVSPLEAALRHDRIIVLAALAGIAAVAWVYMVYEARGMDRTGVCQCLGMAMSGPDTQPWATAAIAPLFLMWAEMMVAMMIPSAAPMILIFARVNRQRREQERPFVPTGLFLLGYLIVWSAFSLVAAVAQWVLHGAALLSPAMKSSSPVFGGASPDRGRRLPVDAMETRLPGPLPFAPELSARRLARRAGGRTRNGPPARRLLRGLLLASDGPALRRRA